MLTRKKVLCIPAMILLILITASTCYTAPQIKIEAVDPALDFPYFPDVLDAQGKPIPRLEGDNVIIPKRLWIGITEYVIEVEKCREIYKAWKEIYFEVNE